MQPVQGLLCLAMLHLLGWAVHILDHACVVAGPATQLAEPADLHCAGRHFGEVHEGAGVGDEACADQLANQCGQIRGNCCHAGLQVVVQLASVVCQGNHLRELAVLKPGGGCRWGVRCLRQQAKNV